MFGCYKQLPLSEVLEKANPSKLLKNPSESLYHKIAHDVFCPCDFVLASNQDQKLSSALSQSIKPFCSLCGYFLVINYKANVSAIFHIFFFFFLKLKVTFTFISLISHWYIPLWSQFHLISKGYNAASGISPTHLLLCHPMRMPSLTSMHSK